MNHSELSEVEELTSPQAKPFDVALFYIRQILRMVLNHYSE